jgi:hypothetical protein|nr:MAG TPA_asm: hypothetical protein [Caudoviricetes sp.]
MSSAKQKILENKRWPHVKRNWIKAIKAIRAIPAARGDYREPKPESHYQQGMAANSVSILTKRTFGERYHKIEWDEMWKETIGFSESSSSDRLTEEQENEIAENIYDWWISGKGYQQWYNEKFRQQTLNF